MSAVAAAPVPVLIVDDNAGKRLALRAVLQPLGYSIVEADSGLAALRCVMAQDFAVILLDVRMPILDGPETAAIVRQRQQSKMTPIIFITASDNDEIDTTDQYAQGAVDFIFAPVRPDELRAKVSVFANMFIEAENLASRAREVQTSSDQWRLLTDAAPIGIFQTDADNRYVYTNPRWSEITGIPADGATGMAWDAIVGALGRTTLVATLADAAALQPEFWLRFEIRLPDFAPRIVQLTSKVIPDGTGGIAGWVGTLADVTAEAGAEAALSEAHDQATEASRLKSDFLANTSHEIRTPMNGVIGMTELLLETDLDAQQRDYAETVRDSGQALLMIINDILDFSRIEAGMLDVEDVPFSVATIVDDVVHLLAEPAQAKGLDLRVVIEDPVPATVGGDPGRVRQVLTNLVGNALKFTQSGEVVVRVGGPRDTATPTPDDPPGGGGALVVRFEVSDTGDGIGPDKVGTIFQPFVQGDTSTSRKYGGTGLGLAICSQLVALMGGECGVTSTLGSGSTFWFTIRVHTETGQPSEAPSPVTDLTPPSPAEPEKGRLLLAEDNLINQKVAVEMLSKAGYEVDTVPDGAAAVRAVAARPYDAILMDCQMPEMNGYEATAAIRALESSGRLTPIIAMTAGARSEDRDRCLEEGMDAYLSKPIRKDSLLALVAESTRHESSATGPTGSVAHDPVDCLDLTVFEELRLLDEATDEDFLVELVEQFVRHTEALLTELRVAWNAGDSNAVYRIAHSVKGGSTQLGGRCLTLSCSHLEERARTTSLPDGLADLDAVESDYRDLRQALVHQLTSIDHLREPVRHA